MNKIIALVLALAAFLFFWKIYPAQPMTEIAAGISNPYAASVTEQQGENRAQLSEENRQLYDVVKSGLLAMNDEIVIRRFAYSEDDLRDVLWYVMSDSPEIFWVEWSWDVRSQDDGIVIVPHYLYSKDDVAAKRTELQTAVESVTAYVNEKAPANEYEKALIVHDWLVAHVAYTDNGELQTHTAYGALVAGQAVCDGYAHALDLVLSSLGIETLYVEGSTPQDTSDTGHAWDVSKLDGTWGHIDVTWDDLDAQHNGDTAFANAISRTFFMLSDEEIAVDHTVDNKAALPACEGNNYFKYYGVRGNLFEDVSGKVEDLLLANIAKGSYYVEFQLIDEADYKKTIGNYDAIGTVIDDVNKELKSMGATQLATKFVSYRSEDHRTMMVLFTPAS